MGAAPRGNVAPRSDVDAAMSLTWRTRVSSVVVVVVVAVVALVPLVAAHGATTSERSWTIERLRLGAGEHLSIGFHPDVAQAEITAVGGRFEVCQAVMNGTAGGDPGQSWPAYTGFDSCIASDHGRVLLPSIVVPTYHVAFFVRGVDDGPVRFSRLRLRYVPGDGFFAFAVPSSTTQFAVVPHDDRSVSVDPVATSGGGAPAGVRVRVVQQGRRVPGIESTPERPDGYQFGPVQPDRPVTIRIARGKAANVAYVVRWS